ncbi:prolipoprotein diacylglyceryl transferase [Eubacterium xylanophilum]|uniref:prolipoprotein diacylglyceryl transferase n=1 Tax=Eubacterium xylanophilum TaxID=39497 RepID=UPI00047A65F5|nr:prolipoprotein diacylglyceryl transferase family protein [Eubacterium xylanophilum]
MFKYINIMGFMVPSYGLLILLGLILGNICEYKIIKKDKLNIYDFIILEAYALLGGFIGAKVLYILISFREIDWNRIADMQYFNQLLKGGFVFYGGLILGALFLFFASKLHGIILGEYLRRCIFILPLVHGMGRIGCFGAGCCYGIRYHGIGAVTFPTDSYAPHGVELFPIQLVEAMGLFVISGILLFLTKKNMDRFIIEIYLISYGIIRFFDEYLRGDSMRGSIGFFSTSQIISMMIILIGIVMLCYRRRKEVVTSDF